MYTIATIITACFRIWLKFGCFCISCKTQEKRKKKNEKHWKNCTATTGCPVTFIWLDRLMTHCKAWHIGNGFIVHGTFLLINIKHIDLRITSCICPNIKVSAISLFEVREIWLRHVDDDNPDGICKHQVKDDTWILKTLVVPPS